MQTYVIGRGEHAAIKVADPSISRFHAELTLADDGRLFLVDRASSEGTWLLIEGRWQSLRQEYVNVNDRICLGQWECSVGDLLRQIAPPPARTGHPTPTPVPAAARRVRRNTQTGEIDPE